jgi:hypothetical protein
LKRSVTAKTSWIPALACFMVTSCTTIYIYIYNIYIYIIYIYIYIHTQHNTNNTHKHTQTQKSAVIYIYIYILQSSQQSQKITKDDDQSYNCQSIRYSNKSNSKRSSSILSKR